MLYTRYAIKFLCHDSEDHFNYVETLNGCLCHGQRSYQILNNNITFEVRSLDKMMRCSTLGNSDIQMEFSSYDC